MSDLKKKKKSKRKVEDVDEEERPTKKARTLTPRKSPRLAGVPASPGLGSFDLGATTPEVQEKKKKKKKKTSSGEVGEAGVKKEKKKKKKKATAEEKVENAEETPQERKTTDSKGNTFITEFPIHADIQKKLSERGMNTLFPIQAACFETALAGHDLIGRARTGTGKTLAFTLPVVQALKNKPTNKKYGRLPRVLVLLPTRELATQVGREFEATSDLSCTTFYGGTAYGPQSNAIRNGLDVVVGTTGRIKDLIERGMLKLTEVEHIVLDEADEMLNMGFAEDVESILSNIPREDREVQTLLFSATLPEWVQKIAEKFLKSDRKLIDLVKTQKLKASAQVRHICIPCHWTEMQSVLGEVMMVYAGIEGRTIIFTETKKTANELAMSPTIKQECQPLHGDIPQAQRERTLQGFRDGSFRCLIATDVAARGLDIPGVDLVIQAEPPADVETYIHRSGRTGRAGATGIAITFYGQKHRWYIEQIERKAGVVFEVTGVPQREEIMAASAKDAIRLLDNVEPDVIQCFSGKAQELIDDKGAVPALAAALAHMAGHTKMLESRSLLTCGKGWVTIIVRTNTEVRSLSYIWNLIRRYLFEECDDKVRGMKFLADMKGAAFDIPSGELHLVKAAEAGQVTFEIPTELPDTLEREAQRPEPRRWGNKRSSGGWGGGRGGGGRGGGSGRGGGRGRGGSRGRGRGSGRGGSGRGSRGRGRW